MKRFLSLVGLLTATLVVLGAPALAQQPETSQATPMPSPAPASTPTLMDRQYDGQLHVTLAPYLWLTNVGGAFQYSIPTLPHRPKNIIESSINIGPNDYLPKLNSAAMFFTDARKGDVDVFADVIYVNASASSTVSTTFAGPRGRLQIPITLDTNAHLSTAIWEVAAGYSIAHGHNADLSLFSGLREFPTNVTFDYNATIVGRRGVIAPSGSIAHSDYLSDLIVGLRGRAFFGDNHFFLPYYADYGSSINSIPNQSWQAYGGFGYAFNHGQTLVAVYRALNFNGFTPVDHVQRLTLAGPLFGYTFQL